MRTNVHRLNNTTFVPLGIEIRKKNRWFENQMFMYFLMVGDMTVFGQTIERRTEITLVLKKQKKPRRTTAEKSPCIRHVGTSTRF